MLLIAGVLGFIFKEPRGDTSRYQMSKTEETAISSNKSVSQDVNDYRRIRISEEVRIN